MTRYEDAEDSENLGERYVHRHYTQSKNGNGKTLNTVVWAIASLLSMAVVSFLILKALDHDARLIKLETIITIEQAIERNR